MPYQEQDEDLKWLENERRGKQKPAPSVSAATDPDLEWLDKERQGGTSASTPSPAYVPITNRQEFGYTRPLDPDTALKQAQQKRISSPVPRARRRENDEYLQRMQQSNKELGIGMLDPSTLVPSPPPPAETPPHLQFQTPGERKARSEAFLKSLEIEKDVAKFMGEAAKEEEASRAATGTVSKMATRFGRGALGGVKGAIQGPVLMSRAPMREEVSARIGEDFDRVGREYLPIDTRKPAIVNPLRGDFWTAENLGKVATETTPEVAGDMAVQLLLGRAAGLGGRLAGSAGSAGLAARGAVSAFGASRGFTQGYEAAKAAGFDEDTARKSGAIEAIIGLFEGAGGAGTTGQFTQKALSAIPREARQEFIQEAFSQLAQGINAAYLTGYDPKKTPKDIIGEALGTGGIGAFLGGAAATPGAIYNTRQQRQAEIAAVRGEQPLPLDLKPGPEAPQNQRAAIEAEILRLEDNRQYYQDQLAELRSGRQTAPSGGFERWRIIHEAQEIENTEATLTAIDSALNDARLRLDQTPNTQVINLAEAAKPEFRKKVEAEAQPTTEPLAGSAYQRSELEDYFERAIAMAQNEGRLTPNMLQRRLGIGYGRAEALIEQLKQDGVLDSAGQFRSTATVPLQQPAQPADAPVEPEAVSEEESEIKKAVKDLMSLLPPSKKDQKEARKQEKEQKRETLYGEAVKTAQDALEEAERLIGAGDFPNAIGQLRAQQEALRQQMKYQPETPEGNKERARLATVIEGINSRIPGLRKQAAASQKQPPKPTKTEQEVERRFRNAQAAQEAARERREAATAIVERGGDLSEAQKGFRGELDLLKNALALVPATEVGWREQLKQDIRAVEDDLRRINAEFKERGKQKKKAEDAPTVGLAAPLFGQGRSTPAQRQPDAPPTARLEPEAAATPETPARKGRIVTVGDDQYELTPEQEAQWEEEVDEAFDEAKRRYDDLTIFDVERANNTLRGRLTEIEARKRQIVASRAPAAQAEAEEPEPVEEPVEPVEDTPDTAPLETQAEPDAAATSPIPEGRPTSPKYDVRAPKATAENIEGLRERWDDLRRLSDDRGGLTGDLANELQELGTRIAEYDGEQAKAARGGRPEETPPLGMRADDRPFKPATREDRQRAFGAVEQEAEQQRMIERRREEREAVPKGVFGKFGEAARHMKGGTRFALAEHPELRELLGLPQMPPYHDEAGKVDPAWNQAAQDTLNALAELGQVPRSSELDLQSLRGVYKRLLLAAQRKKQPISEGLKQTFRETVEAAMIANENFERFITDVRIHNILRTLDDAASEGRKLNLREKGQLANSTVTVAREHGLTKHFADNWFKAAQAGASRRAESRRDQASEGDRREGDKRDGEGDVSVEERATGTLGQSSQLKKSSKPLITPEPVKETEIAAALAEFNRLNDAANDLTRKLAFGKVSESDVVEARRKASEAEQRYKDAVARELAAKAKAGEAGSKPGTVTHPNPAIDRQPILAETNRDTVIVPNPNNKTGISEVKDHSDEPAEHKFSSTQVDLPKEIADQIIAYGERIPDADLADDGREDKPHITVKFGLHGADSKFTRQALEGEGPITIKFGKVSLFENDEFDVVKIDIESPDLHRLNKKIAESQPVTDTFPTYQPHATIAYVRKGKGKKYVGDTFLEGQTATLNSVTFSGRDGEIVEIPLAGKPAAPAKQEVLSSENVALLKDFGIDARKVGANIIFSGKTYDIKEIIKDAGGRFSDKAWRLTPEGAAKVIDRLRGLPRPARGQRGNVPDHVKDSKIGELRRTLESRPDRSGLDRAIGDYVGSDTQSLLKRGVKAGIPENVIDEQIEDVAKIKQAFTRGQGMFLLASEPGSGKTFVLGAAIRELRRAGAKKIVYVTLRKELIDQIKNDLADYEIGDVEFVTYPEIRTAGVRPSDVLIFDEAHGVKNTAAGKDGARQAKAAANWIKRAKFAIFSTATPFENPTQAAYLEPTGIFEPAGGFNQWARAFGASKFNVGEKTILIWRRGPTSDADAKAARDYFKREGVFTSRSIHFPDGKVDARFAKIMASEEAVRRYTIISEAAERRNLALTGAMWIVNFQKRLLEAAKVERGIEEARSALARGRFPIIFVETKAERILDIPDLQRRQREYESAVAMAQRMKDSPPPRSAFGLPPDGIVEVLGDYMSATGEEKIVIPSAEDVITKALGADNVAIFTGSVTPKKAQQNLDAWRRGDKKVIVATMAKGGTGLSLHDKKGNHPTTQIVINLPWTATAVKQVAQRNARYGLQSKAEILWIFADNIPFDRKLAAKVGGRMADMGASVYGDTIKEASSLEDWDFEAKTFSEINDELDAAPPAETKEAPAAIEQPARREVVKVNPDDIVSRIYQIKPAARTGAPVSIASLRAEFPNLSKEAFDAEMAKLSKQGRIALHRHDHPSQLDEAERNKLVKIGNDYFTAVTITERTKPEAKTDRGSKVARYAQQFVDMARKDDPEYYSTPERLQRLEQDSRKSAEAILGEIEAKNVTALAQRLETSNPLSRRIFEQETGAFLGKTNKDLIPALKKWAGAEGEAAFARQEEEKQAEAQTRKEGERERVIEDKKYTVDGRVVSARQMIDDIFSQPGEFSITTEQRGAVKQYFIVRKEGSRTEATRLDGAAIREYAERKLKEKTAPAPEPKKPIRSLKGKETALSIPRSDNYTARYEVWDLEDVQPSHDPFSFQPNPKYNYTNDRDYTNLANRIDVEKNTMAGQFDPRIPLSTDPTATTGPPLVKDTGDVLGGNSRTMMIARVYKNHPEDAQKYKDLLKEYAPIFGINAAEVDIFKQPILVRVVAETRGRTQKLLTDLNIQPGKAMSSTEAAQARAKNLTPETLQFLSDRLAAEGAEGTLAMALEGKKGVEIFNRLTADGVFTEGDRGKYVTKQGVLDAPAKQEIENIILARVFRDTRQMDKAPADIRNKLIRVAPHLMKMVGTEWDITDLIPGAVGAVAASKAQKLKLSELNKREGMFGAISQYSPQELAIAEWLKDRGPRQVEDAFKTYVKEFEAAEKGTSLFGEPTTQAEGFAYAFKMEEPPEQGTLLSVQRTGAQEPAGFWGTRPLRRDEEGNVTVKAAELDEDARSEFREHRTRARLYTNEQGAFLYAGAINEATNAQDADVIPINVDGLAVPLRRAWKTVFYLRAEAVNAPTPAVYQVYQDMADNLEKAIRYAERNGDNTVTIVSTEVRHPTTGRKSFREIRKTAAHEEAHGWDLNLEGRRDSDLFDDDVITSDPDYELQRQGLIDANYPEAYLTPKNVQSEVIAHIAAGQWQNLGYDSEADALGYLERLFDRVYDEFGEDALSGLRLRTHVAKGARENVIARRDRQGLGAAEASESVAGRETGRIGQSLRGREEERGGPEQGAEGDVRDTESALAGARQRGLDKRALAGAAITGATKLSHSSVSFGDWSVDMIRDFGNPIRPHLLTLWQQSKALQTTTPIEELVQASKDYAEWRDWYDRHEKPINALFDDDADLFRQILAATSQRQGVKGNVTQALKAYRQMKTGEPFTGHLIGVIRNLERIRRGEPIKGPKIGDYGRGMTGKDVDAMAVDRHVAEVLFGTKSPTPKQIERGKFVIRTIARKLGWTRIEAQSVLWAYNQIRKGKEPNDYEQELTRRADEIRDLRAEISGGKGRGVSQRRGIREGTEEGGQGPLAAIQRGGGRRPLVGKSTPLRALADAMGHAPLRIDPASVAKESAETLVEALSRGPYGSLPGARAAYWAKKLGAKKTAKRFEKKQAEFIKDAVGLIQEIATQSLAMGSATRGSLAWEKARRELDRTRVKLSNHLSKSVEYTHPAEYVTKGVKASLLSALHIPEMNLIYQAWQFPLHELQKSIDFLVPAKAFAKRGIKYDKAPVDIRQWAPAIGRELGAIASGAMSSFGDIMDMLRYGVTESQLDIEAAERLAGHQTGQGTTDKYEFGHRPKMIPGLDQAIMEVGRGQGAADILFTNIVYATALAAAADATARKTLSSVPGRKYTNAQIKDLARDLAADPSPAMVAVAGQEAARFRLDYPTLGYEMLQKLRELKWIKKGGPHVESTWKAAFDWVFLFRKIPTAAIDTAFFRYSPVGLARIYFPLVGRLSEAKRKKAQGREYTGRYKTAEAFGRDTAELYRQGIIGTLAWATLYALGNFGYLAFTGGGDDDKREDVRAAREALGEKYAPEMIVGDRAFELHRMGPVGQAAAAGARVSDAFKPRFNKERQDYESDFERYDRAITTGAKAVALGTPLGQGAADIVEALESEGATQKGASYLTSKARAVVPGLVRDVAKITSPSKVIPEDPSVMGRFKSDLQAGIPAYRKKLQPRLDALGRPVKEPNPFSFVRSRQGDTTEKQLEELRDLDVGITKPTRQKGESAEAFNKRVRERGEMAIKTLGELAEDETMRDAGKDARRAVYERSLESKQMERAGRLSSGSVRIERQIEAMRGDTFAALRSIPEYLKLSEEDKKAVRGMIDEELKLFRATAASVDSRGRFRKEAAAVRPDWTPAELARIAMEARNQ